jgi:hypothetical protein
MGSRQLPRPVVQVPLAQRPPGQSVWVLQLFRAHPCASPREGSQTRSGLNVPQSNPSVSQRAGAQVPS